MKSDILQPELKPFFWWGIGVAFVVWIIGDGGDPVELTFSILLLGFFLIAWLYDILKNYKKNSEWKIKIVQDIEKELAKRSEKSRLDCLLELKKLIEEEKYGYGAFDEEEVRKYRNDLLLNILNKIIENEKNHGLIKD